MQKPVKNSRVNRRTLVLLLSGSMLCQVTGCAAAVVPVALSLLESSLISALLGGVL